jgi:Tfp pilus assembly protein PilO
MPLAFDFFKNLPELKLDEAKKKILLMYGVGILVIFIVYVMFFLKPSVALLINLLPKMQVRKADIKAVRNDLPLEERLLKKREYQRGKLGQYEKKLSREKEVPLLLENLSKTARSSRVKILSITPLKTASRSSKKSAAEKQGVYQEVPIRITARSGYHELATFINRLEKDERYMLVTDLKIRSNRNNFKRHDIDFVVYAYTFKSGKDDK